MPNGVNSHVVQTSGMTKRSAALPIGRTAKIAYEIDALRADCCKAAHALTRHEEFDDADLEECARLDEALAQAHRLLKITVRNIIMARLNRRSRIR